jgi:hypothetical protein
MRKRKDGGYCECHSQEVNGFDKKPVTRIRFSHGGLSGGNIQITLRKLAAKCSIRVWFNCAASRLFLNIVSPQSKDVYPGLISF